MPRLNHLPEWAALAKHRAELGEVHLRDLFADDPDRGSRYSLQAGDLYLDYGKHLVTDETLRLLQDLAAARGVASLRDAMFRGDKINFTEHRAVLHTALRAPRDAEIVVDGENVVPKVHAVLDRMAAFADRIRSGEWTGYTGERITTVVNIGIGGSGPGAGPGGGGPRGVAHPPPALYFVFHPPGAPPHPAAGRPAPAPPPVLAASGRV